MNSESVRAGRCRIDAARHDEAELVDRDRSGFGTRITSPGAVIACATLAKPSFEPSVATTCVSGLSFTPKRRA